MSTQMALALNASEALTMSSLEIAELTGKEHKQVLRDIRVMLVALGAADQFWATASVPGPNGSTRAVPVANLPKRETVILVTGYSIPMRAAVVDRWQELEAAVAGSGAPKVPQTLAKAHRASVG